MIDVDLAESQRLTQVVDEDRLRLAHEWLGQKVHGVETLVVDIVQAGCKRGDPAINALVANTALSSHSEVPPGLAARNCAVDQSAHRSD